MSTFILRTIDIDLSTESINSAIRDIRKFYKDLQYALSMLVQELVEDGVTVAKMTIMHLNAVETGNLEESIYGIYNKAERVGYVVSPTPYAIFVEYGTGIVGMDTNEGELPLGYVHDYNNHGDSGWWYYKKVDGHGSFRWTKGMRARPFMYRTFRELERRAEKYGGEIIASYIP